MKKIFKVIVIQSLLTGFFCLLGPSSLLAKDPFGFYYGSRFTDKLLQYETVVLDSQNFASTDLKKLQNNNVRVITYVSIGETDTLILGDRRGPGGFASWYFDGNGDGRPDQNPNWGSYYVDASNEKWHEHVLNRVIPSLPGTINGLFLDTVDTADIHKETREGMISLIKKIKQRYPDYFIVQNRGFHLIEETAESVDAVLFEDFSTYYDFEKLSYKRWTGEDLSYTDTVAVLLNQVRRTHPLEVWTLEYREATDQDVLAYTLRRAARFGFLPSSTNIDITRLDTMNQDSIDDETNEELLARHDITDASVSDSLRDIVYTIQTRGPVDPQAMHIQFFLKTPDSGNPLFRFIDSFPANYLVEDGFLYGYAGDGESWEWDRISKVPWQVKDNSYTVAINMSFLKIDQNQLLEAVAATQDQDWEYQDSTGVLRFVSKMNQYSTRGDTHYTASPSGDAKELGATVGLSSMKVEIGSGMPLDAYKHYGVFIDTDGVDKGYGFHNITASHLILNDNLYRYNGDGKSWKWLFIMTCPSEPSEKTITYTLDYRDIDFTKGSAELAGAFMEAGTDEIQVTRTLQVLRNYPTITPISY